MIDIHCHILPGLDDGPSSLDESLAMARRAVEDGVHTIVATPHTLNAVYMNHAKEITARVDTVQEVLSENQIDLKIYPGADVHICPNLLTRIESGDASTINHGNKYILLELPSQTIPEGIKNEIFTLTLNSITPIISHPERNAIIQHDPVILYDLLAMGALSQVTAMSLTGGFGMFVSQTAEALLRQRLIHIIASDAHSPEGRPPVLSHAVDCAAEILGSYDEAKYMVTNLPAAILCGEAVDIPEPSREKQRPGFFAQVS